MGLLDKKLFKVLKGAVTGNYGEVITTIAQGLGVKSESKIAEIAGGADKAQEIIGILSGDAAERLASDREMIKFMEENDAKKMESFSAFLIATEQTAQNSPIFIQIVRGLVRPLITYSAMALTVFLLYMNVINGVDIGEEAWTLLKLIDGVTLFFWFGGRSVQYVMKEIKGGPDNFINKIS